MKPPTEKRPLGQTYLVYPEWLIVFFTQELAEHLRTNQAHSFPYLSSIFAYWRAYWTVSRVKVPGEKTNYEYHSMLVFIGVFYTVEMGVKAIYERTFGFLFSSKTRDPIDEFYCLYTKEYGEWMNHTPWYKYDFKSVLLALKCGDPKTVHGKERKIMLKVELLLKKWIGSLLCKFEGGAESESTEECIRLRVSGKPKHLPDGVTILEQMQNQTVLVLKRYINFDKQLRELLQKNPDLEILDIAGNEKIAFCATTHHYWGLREVTHIFSSKTYDGSNKIRCLFEAPVSKIPDILGQENQRGGMKVVKLFDY